MVAPSTVTSMAVKTTGILPTPVQETAPTTGSDRLTVKETAMSLLVNDVSKAAGSIEELAMQSGGYMVNKYLNQPEGAATGNITIRVPVEKRDSVLSDIRKLGVKVVMENTYGHDVTDQYTDLNTRIAQLESTKEKMQSLMDKAIRVSDLVDIQNQINYIQQQIDNDKGQQNYLTQTAKLTKITVDLSTDELALPYSPTEAWRPTVVFKTAVRSMISTLRWLANGAIWAVVYLPVVLVAVIIVWLLIRIRKKHK